jgi:protein SCO1/2
MMYRSKKRLAAFGFAALLPLAAGAAGATDPQHQGMSPDKHAEHRTLFNNPVKPAKKVKVDLRDLELVDQEGRRGMFASELIGDKLVALNIFYSDCTTVCPVTSAIFAQLQDRLGERMDREVRLISLTVDPITDTPPRLKAYSRKHGTKPGWFWMTGSKPAMDEVLDGLGLYSADYTEHPAAVLVGDSLSGEWRRFYGFSSPAQILDQLNLLQAKRQQATRQRALAATRDKNHFQGDGR